MLSESAHLFGGPLDRTQRMVMASPPATTIDDHRYVQAGRIDAFTLRYVWGGQRRGRVDVTAVSAAGVHALLLELGVVRGVDRRVAATRRR